MYSRILALDLQLVSQILNANCAVSHYEDTAIVAGPELPTLLVRSISDEPVRVLKL